MHVFLFDACRINEEWDKKITEQSQLESDFKEKLRKFEKMVTELFEDEMSKLRGIITGSFVTLYFVDSSISSQSTKFKSACKCKHASKSKCCKCGGKFTDISFDEMRQLAVDWAQAQAQPNLPNRCMIRMKLDYILPKLQKYITEKMEKLGISSFPPIKNSEILKFFYYQQDTSIFMHPTIAPAIKLSIDSSEMMRRYHNQIIVRFCRLFSWANQVFSGKLQLMKMPYNPMISQIIDRQLEMIGNRETAEALASIIDGHYYPKLAASLILNEMGENLTYLAMNLDVIFELIERDHDCEFGEFQVTNEWIARFPAVDFKEYGSLQTPENGETQVLKMEQFRELVNQETLKKVEDGTEVDNSSVVCESLLQLVRQICSH